MPDCKSSTGELICELNRLSQGRFCIHANATDRENTLSITAIDSIGDTKNILYSITEEEQESSNLDLWHLQLDRALSCIIHGIERTIEKQQEEGAYNG